MDCYRKALTLCPFTVKQEAALPSTAWKGSPLPLAWDEWMDCQPTKNLPKHYWIIVRAKLKNHLQEKFPKFVWWFSMDLRQTLSQKTGYQITIAKDLRSSVSQIVKSTGSGREQDTGISFHSSGNENWISQPHSAPLHKISGYPKSQILAEILLPSNQCHVPNLRIPTNALMLSSGYLLDMLVRCSEIIFLWISDSTTARSPPSRLHHARAEFHSLAKEVPGNTRKHESFTTNQPESHVDPVKPITNVTFILSESYAKR